MTKRTPTLESVAQLNRDEWETLCQSLCSTLYSAARVEDRRGKGNGLDAWRYIEDGIEGWQFRRYDARFGDKQAQHVIEGIALAHKRCADELKKPLVKYNLVFNIDPEPGHLKKKGEIQRLAEISEWCRKELGVSFNFSGISWVHSLLLKNPYWMPTLFEDIHGTLIDARDAILSEMFDIKAELRNLAGGAEVQSKLNRLLAKVIEEARTHYERGESFGKDEDYIKAINSLEDAARLVKGENVDVKLEGRILMLLSGIQAITGHLAGSVENSKRAMLLLQNIEDQKYYLFAKGNFAFGSYMSQQYSVAETVFQEILLEFEKEGNLIEIVRTLTHIVEVYTQQDKYYKALDLSERLKDSAMSLDKVIGFSEYSLSAMGTVANALAGYGCESNSNIHKEALYNAIKVYESIEEIAPKVHLIRMRISSKFGRAKCLWNLDQLDEALSLFSEVEVEAKTLIPKVCADSEFNKALILLEKGNPQEACENLNEAKKGYLEMGDLQSVNDVDRILVEIKPQ
jgi:tetratricopeptide (TPR) repeat protein